MICVTIEQSYNRGCTIARWLRRSLVRPQASLCMIRWLRNNNFTGPILASITALTRLAYLYAAPPPVRSSGRFGCANGHVAAQRRHRQPLLRQPAVDDLCVDCAHCHVRPDARPGYRRGGACLAAQVHGCACAFGCRAAQAGLPRGASAWVLCSARPHPSLCAIRYLNNNHFTGPILASITALTRLVNLYAPLPPCDLPADSGVRMSTLRHRALGGNRLSGSLPPTISALTALTFMCVPTRGRATADAVHASLRKCMAARALLGSVRPRLVCLAARARGRLVRLGRTPHCARSGA